MADFQHHPFVLSLSKHACTNVLRQAQDEREKEHG
jgi:hypothetical protein